jgi:hypothetical protein
MMHCLFHRVDGTPDVKGTDDMNAQIQQSKPPTHRVQLGGETHLVNPETFQQVCDALVERHGGTPLVETLPGVKGARLPGCNSALQEILKDGPPIHEGELDAKGRDRSNAARFELRANGFSPAPPVYAVGSRVNELGVRNAESSRVEYDALARVSEYCGALIQTVIDEHRKDVKVDRFTSMRMTPDGMVTRGKEPVRLTEQAFGGLITRAGIGGHQYLSKCPPALRATNINFWQEEAARNELVEEAQAMRLKDKSWKPKDATFRTRINRGNREVFAVVSGSYGAFDVDKIAQALSMASPPDARGSVVYDGTRAKFEVLFHSNVAPEEFVAGEFFKAGVLVRTDDTGSGAIRISAVVWQNLCLNLIVLDECVQEIAAIRHVGTVEALAVKFREGFKKALGSIDQFLEKWNYAAKDDVSSHLVDERHVSLPVSMVLPGLFNGILERELVTVRGSRKDAVAGLVRMYEKDDSAARVNSVIDGVPFVSRAAVVNAFTRYAHEVNSDPFEQDTIERQAGGLLNVTRANAELPYEPIDL